MQQHASITNCIDQTAPFQTNNISIELIDLVISWELIKQIASRVWIHPSRDSLGLSLV